MPGLAIYIHREQDYCSGWSKEITYYFLTWVAILTGAEKDPWVKSSGASVAPRREIFPFTSDDLNHLGDWSSTLRDVRVPEVVLGHRIPRYIELRKLRESRHTGNNLRDNPNLILELTYRSTDDGILDGHLAIWVLTLPRHMDLWNKPSWYACIWRRHLGNTLGPVLWPNEFNSRYWRWVLEQNVISTALSFTMVHWYSSE